MKRTKKTFALLLCVVMVACMLPISALAVDDYPAKYKNAPLDSIVDEWNFYNRECTSFCAWCLNSRNGVAFHNWYGGIRWGNANNWGNTARQLGIRVDNTPSVGSIAWSTAGTYGHVAWVSAVNGNNVSIEEYNYGYDGYYHERTVAASSFTGYIHLNDNVKPTVTFEPWESSQGNTYIGETDASIGQRITVSGGTCTDTGMYLYDRNGNHLATGSNGFYNDVVYFKINEELHYTLTPGTLYKYKFYAVVNGETYWSNEGSFTTLTFPVSTDTSGSIKINDGFYSIAPQCALGSRIDVANASTEDGANIQLYQSNGSNAQKFTITNVSGNYYKIEAQCSGKVLNVDNYDGSHWSNVNQYTWNGTNAQLWLFYDAGDGYYYIKPAVNTNLSLDDANYGTENGTNISVVKTNNSSAQTWKLYKETPPTTPVTSVTLDKTSLSLNKGETATLKATVKPDNATNKTVTWKSSNTSVATVDNNGKVTAVAAGSATITATAGDKSATCTVTVTDPKPIDANSPQFVVDSKTASAGSEVKVNISLKNNPGIASIKMKVAYGSDLTLTAVDYNSAMGGSSQPPETMTSPVTLNWYNGTANTTGDKVFVTLTFKVSDKAKAGSTSDITVTYNADDVYNISEKNVTFGIQNGKITVSSHTPGDINGDGSVNNKDLTRLFQYLSDWKVEIQQDALDVNGDGSVNNKDLTRLFQYLSDWKVEIF